MGLDCGCLDAAPDRDVTLDFEAKREPRVVDNLKSEPKVIFEQAFDEIVVPKSDQSAACLLGISDTAKARDTPKKSKEFKRAVLSNKRELRIPKYTLAQVEQYWDNTRKKLKDGAFNRLSEEQWVELGATAEPYLVEMIHRMREGEDAAYEFFERGPKPFALNN